MRHLIDCYKLWQEIIRRFPKDLRYTLGGKITATFLEVLENLFSASITSLPQKLPFLQKASLKLDLLKFFLQVAWESKALQPNQYAAISGTIDHAGKMLGGWQRDTLNKVKQTPPAKAGL